MDVTEEKLALARQLGAAYVVNAATVDPVAAIDALGGADVAVVLAAGPRVIEQAHPQWHLSGVAAHPADLGQTLQPSTG